MIRNPKVFLFDEPFSNLDAMKRIALRSELKRLQTELKTTTIHVTHDQEAMTLGNRVAVMRNGIRIDINVTHRKTCIGIPKTSLSLILLVPRR